MKASNFPPFVATPSLSARTGFAPPGCHRCHPCTSRPEEDQDDIVAFISAGHRPPPPSPRQLRREADHAEEEAPESTPPPHRALFFDAEWRIWEEMRREQH
uniref:Uncharacterized protein n=1 Tax=Arundo donax TaxID=35708 RepID=A0A0A9NMU6_ARUDO